MPAGDGAGARPALEESLIHAAAGGDQAQAFACLIPLRGASEASIKQARSFQRMGEHIGQRAAVRGAQLGGE